MFLYTGYFQQKENEHFIGLNHKVLSCVKPMRERHTEKETETERDTHTQAETERERQRKTETAHHSTMMTCICLQILGAAWCNE